MPKLRPFLQKIRWSSAARTLWQPMRRLADRARPLLHRTGSLLASTWPFFHHTLLIAVVCAAVIGVNVLLGQLSFQVYHQFWFSVFWFSFTPIWLTCYGLFCTTRWRWYEFGIGVTAALFLITLYVTRSVEENAYQTALALFLTGIGTTAAMAGFWMNRLFRSLRRDFASSKEPPRLVKGTPFKG